MHLQHLSRRLYSRWQTRPASYGTGYLIHTAIPFCIHSHARRWILCVVPPLTYLFTLQNADTTPLELPPSMLAQPIPFDSDGQMRIDLLGIQPGVSQLRMWKNIWNASDPSGLLYEM
jgi:hypothetical protein